MKSRSLINKGLRFVNYLVLTLKERLDKNAHIVSGSGAGNVMKGDLFIPSLSVVGEAKNADNFNIGPDWEQTKRQAFQDQIPVLFVRHPKKPEFQETLVIMDFGDWLDMAAGQKGEVKVISNKSESLKWAVRNLVEAGKKVNRLLENE